MEGEEGEEYEEEDEEDYSAASTTSGPKKAHTKTSFWGWMDQVFTFVVGGIVVFLTWLF